MTNKHFEELIEQIRKEKDINSLIESFDDFNLHFSCKPDRKIYPYPNNNDVIDENKTVKWNREEVKRLRERFENRVVELNKYKNKLFSEYKYWFITLLNKDNNISYSESFKIWEYAYSENHSSGIKYVVFKYEEIVDLYNDLLKSHNK